MLEKDLHLSELKDLLFAILELVKNTFVIRLGFLPVLKDLFTIIPDWLYLFIGPITLWLIYIALKFIAVKAYLFAIDRFHGSSLGTTLERRKMYAMARKLARKKEHGRAADLYMTLHEDGKAAKVLEKGGLIAKAGQMYEKMGKVDKAIDLYEKAGEHAWHADALLSQGKYAEAAEILRKAGKPMLAAEAYEKAGMHTEAARLFEEAGHTLSAAMHFEEAGNTQKAAVYYDRAFVETTSSKEMNVANIEKYNQYSMKAGKYYREIGENVKAVECYARVKAYPEAAECALLAGDKMKAAELFESGKMYERAAELFGELGNPRRASELMADKYFADGNYVKAAEMLAESSDFIKAAELYNGAGEYGKAGECYMKSREYYDAAAMFEKAGDDLQAAEAYEKNGDFKISAELYVKLGDVEKAASLVESAGEYFSAAKMFRNAGLPAKEFSALQKVRQGDPGYLNACGRMADILREQGKLDVAAQKYVIAIGDSEPDEENIGYFYGLGTIYESDGKFKEAVQMYKKIQLVDIAYKDVEERVTRCEAQVSAPGSGAGIASQQSPARQPGMRASEISASAGIASAESPASRPGISSPAGPNAAAGASDASKRYKILQEIGRGGMGVVYKAMDNNLNRVIAIKLLSKSISDNPKAIMRFSAEARSAAQLNNSNIVTLYDFQQAGGRSFITMEYVEGVTLRKLQSMVDRLAMAKALKIIYQCCQGLDYAHRKGIIHRDIKPSNIMITRQNMVKIMDFGLAKSPGDEALTDAGSISGTIMYMSPEQITGAKLGSTTDIYSLGLVLYELIAGKHPFAEGDAGYHNVHTAPVPPIELRPEIPASLNSLIMKCLEKDPSKRFESAYAFAMALREIPLK
jgi:tetratricopeptide (TPR) repeat protein